VETGQRSQGSHRAPSTGPSPVNARTLVGARHRWDSTAPSSSTNNCSAGASSAASRARARGPTVRTTTSSSSRRTGPWCVSRSATAGTTPWPSSTVTCGYGWTSFSPKCAWWPSTARVRSCRRFD
jgi:hypothetical protein